ncbi:hypothetical protein EJB05_15626, partial [Eragrostis curvula]
MRMSCNGCRVLRKGCSDACTIRPCLQWIKTPEAQANATVFLAKFYGRAGLLNLLAAPGPGADHLRPAVFRSLLYEACGRIVNPVYGSVGLLWSGQWQACQAAVEAVLKGDPVVRVASAEDVNQPEAAATPPLGTRAACDIRHVAKDRDAAAAADLLRVARAGRTKFKRASSSSASKTKQSAGKPSSKQRASSPRPGTPTQEQEEPVVVGGSGDEHDDARAPSHHDDHGEESAGSHQHLEGSSQDTEAEAGSHVSQAEEHHSHVAPAASHRHDEVDEEEEVGLDLTLGLEPPVARQQAARSPPTCDLRGLSAASSLMGLRLELPA